MRISISIETEKFPLFFSHGRDRSVPPPHASLDRPYVIELTLRPRPTNTNKSVYDRPVKSSEQILAVFFGETKNKKFILQHK